MSLIHVTNVSFSYEGSFDAVFENISLQLDTDWKLGFTGRNGRGKTTFLNLLQGKYEYSGTITSAVEFAYFPYRATDREKNTLSIIDAISPRYQFWELSRELSLLEVSEDVLTRPFSTLSGGEQTKVLLAALFLTENRFLLIDEPTNHLDRRGREILGNYLSKKQGFILVSHDRAFLDRCVDHILSINKRDIEIQKGNFSSFLQNRERKEQFEQMQNEKIKKDVKRLTEAAKRASDWSDRVEKTKYGTKNSGLSPDRGYLGHKSAKMMKRSKAIEGRTEAAMKEKRELLQNLESMEKLKIPCERYHSDRLAELRNVTLSYDGKTACENVSFSIMRGDRIALTGKNGSGKSSILKLIRGEHIDFTGDYHKGSGLNISYVSQDASFLKGNLSGFAEDSGIEESLFRAILSKLDISKDQFLKDMGDFSNGQKKKVLLAKSLCEKAHLYVWDEPLNYIDVLSRMQIESLLTEFCPTILFVEHDGMFCDRVATKTVAL